jgi:hypothetical protein
MIQGRKMTEITLFNNNTFLRKARNCAIVGAVSFSVISGAFFADQYSKNKMSSKKTDAVMNALKSDEILLAENIFNSSSTILTSESREKMKLEIEKAKKKRNLEQKITENDFNGASEIFNDFKKSHLLSANDLTIIERRLYSLSDEGLYKQIMNSSTLERINLCHNYLNLHPKGDKRKDVASNLISSEIRYLSSELLMKDAEFSKANSQILHVAYLLEYFSKENITLLKSLVVELKKSSDYYLEPTDFIPVQNDIFIGKEVKTRGINSERTNWNKKYLEERNATFPKGTKGKIVNVDGEMIFVKFEKISQYNWKNDWEPANMYWKNGKKNIADYYREELLVEKETLSISEKEEYQKNMGRLNSLLQSYFTRQK